MHSKVQLRVVQDFVKPTPLAISRQGFKNTRAMHNMLDEATWGPARDMTLLLKDNYYSKFYLVS